MRTVSIIKTGRNCWRLTFDGSILGDSRGFSKDGAWREAQQTVTSEQRWANRDNRPIELKLGEFPIET